MERKNSPLVILYQSKLFAFTSFIVFYTVLALVILYDRCIFRLKIEGRENLTACPRAFLISNHSLYLDPAIIAHVINPKRTYFTAEEPTFYRGFVGPLIRLLGAFPMPGGAALSGTSVMFISFQRAYFTITIRNRSDLNEVYSFLLSKWISL